MTAQLTSWIADLGLAGVFALMAVDALLPAGGELIMLFAGALAAGAISGHPASSLAAAVAAGTLGYLAGSLAGWALGRAGGRPFIERHGRWLHLGPERFRRAERWFGRYAAAVLGLPLSDLTGGFKCFRAGALRALDGDLVHSRGYAFQIELTFHAARAGLEIAEIPIVFREREHGSSKMSPAIALEAMWRVPPMRLGTVQPTTDRATA